MLSSIKAKIIVFYMAVLFAILSALGVFLYFSLSKIVYDSIDSSLLSRAKALATLVSSDNSETEFDFSDEIMWEYNSPKARSYFQIRDFDGTTLEKSASLGDSELPFPEKESFDTILLRGSPARVINFRAPDGSQHTAKSKGRGLLIQCAEDIRDQMRLLKNYRFVLSLSVFSIMIVSALGGFFIARKALTPVREISDTIGRISESNLSERVTVEGSPKELRVLASSFNRTLDHLETAFNRQRQFAADASHELRTPLSVVLSQSEIMLRKDRTAGEYRSALAAVREAATMMSEIVRKLLAIARLSSDTVELKFETLNLSEIIRDSIKLLSPFADQRGVRIDLSKSEAREFVVRGDRAALLELFSNLIDNAIKYNVPHGKIDISFKKEPASVVTEIRDTGIGIPEGDLDKVFDRFYRVDKSRSKDSGGTGLGLSICNEIVKLHGGRIEIKSNLGSGTTVSVFLKEDRGVARLET